MFAALNEEGKRRIVYGKLTMLSELVGKEPSVLLPIEQFSTVFFLASNLNYFYLTNDNFIIHSIHNFSSSFLLVFPLKMMLASERG